jgi:hypothetical protein
VTCFSHGNDRFEAQIRRPFVSQSAIVSASEYASAKLPHQARQQATSSRISEQKAPIETSSQFNIKIERESEKIKVCKNCIGIFFRRNSKIPL